MSLTGYDPWIDDANLAGIMRTTGGRDHALLSVEFRLGVGEELGMARTANEIADMRGRLQEYYAAISTALVLLNDDDVMRMLQAKGYDPGSTITLGRRDNSYYEGIKLWDSIHSVRGNAGFNLDFLGSQLMTIISWVGAELST